ncbi:MAG TPA: hypothetical protein VK880_03315, partial [Anaerolineales bacterium]|nr:hypothetical protein [Anaerolineales bacterium]
MITLAAMVLLSIPIARRSARQAKINGGTGAQVFHFLGAAVYIGVIPAALCGSILVGPFKLGIPLALGLLAVSFLLLVGYAIFERPALAALKPAEDRGWT